MTLPLYGVYGAGGCGRDIMPMAREQLKHSGASLNRLVFVDDRQQGDVVNGQRVMTFDEFVAAPASVRRVVVAVADGSVRKRLAGKCAAASIEPWSVAAANAITMDNVILGEGSVLSSFVTLTSNIRVGKHFQANIYSYVTHDCEIGDFVTFAPAVKCNGNVVIEDGAYIGTGAILKQGKPGQPLIIGRGAVVGMGAVVTRNVAAGETVVGNPARPMARKA